MVQFWSRQLRGGLRQIMLFTASSSCLDIPSRPLALISETSVPRLSLLLPMVSSASLLSPSLSVDITETLSPSVLGSPFLRPRAPTPGSIASRLSTLLDVPERHLSCRDSTYSFESGQWLTADSCSRSPSLLFQRPCAPTPGSVNSLSPVLRLSP